MIRCNSSGIRAQLRRTEAKGRALLSLGTFALALCFSTGAAAQGVVAQATGGTGAVVSEEEAFPLHLTTTLSSSLGSGWLSPGYTRQPNFAQSLTLLPAAKLPDVEWLPSMTLVGRLDLSILWLDSFQTSFGDGTVRLSDFSVILNVPKLWQEDFTGIRIGTNLSVRAPLSLASRRWNILGTAGASFPINWSTAKLSLPVGVFFVSYVPSFTYIQHTNPNPTLPREGSPIDDFVPRFGAPVEQLERLPLLINRPEECFSNGECIVPGRRPIGTVVQSGTVGWNLGKHTVIVSAAHMNQILVALNDLPDLSSPYASDQFFNEWTSGTVAYSYAVPMESFKLPIATTVSITMGVTSFQPAWDAKGEWMRFPFWDFVSPARNFSAAFIDLNVGI